MKQKGVAKDLFDLYNTRFGVFERVRREKLWQVLANDFFQKYIPQSAVVLDVGAGSCEFINSIKCGQKYALDLNPQTKKFAAKNVKVLSRSADEIGAIFKSKIDVVFMSNFLEHLESKEQVYNVLKQVFLALRPGGHIMVLQPDIRLVGNEYWDFFDHKTPITKKSAIEALESVGFKITDLIYPFMPYTTDTRFLPKSTILLRIYLKIRILQLIFGKQFFVRAQKLTRSI